MIKKKLYILVFYKIYLVMKNVQLPFKLLLVKKPTLNIFILYICSKQLFTVVHSISNINKTSPESILKNKIEKKGNFFFF